MNQMLSTLGLLANTLGAFLVLTPELPAIFKRMYKLPPLRTIESAEKKLYQEGELNENDRGFEHIQEAVISGARPFSDIPRLDQVEGNKIVEAVPDGKGGTTTKEFDQSGYQIYKIQKLGGETLATSTFDVQYRPEVMRERSEWLQKHGVSPLAETHLGGQIEGGRLPEYVNEYKRRIVFRAGAGLLVIGFLLQIIARFV